METRANNEKVLASLQPEDIVKFHNEKVLASLQPGDIVKFRRKKGLYCHYGIFVGNERVIHRGRNRETSNDCDSCFSPSGIINNKAVIREDYIWDVAADCEAERHNMFDNRFRRFDSEEIVKRARRKVGEKGYNLFTRNCEHFVTWCRYDLQRSEQVVNAMRITIKTIWRLLLALVFSLFRRTPSTDSEAKKSDLLRSSGVSCIKSKGENGANADKPGKSDVDCEHPCADSSSDSETKEKSDPSCNKVLRYMNNFESELRESQLRTHWFTPEEAFHHRRNKSGNFTARSRSEPDPYGTSSAQKPTSNSQAHNKSICELSCLSDFHYDMTLKNRELLDTFSILHPAPYKAVQCSSRLSTHWEHADTNQRPHEPFYCGGDLTMGTPPLSWAPFYCGGNLTMGTPPLSREPFYCGGDLTMGTPPLSREPFYCGENLTMSTPPLL